MTGLFHRLARQVVGPEPPRVRSATRLPFADPPSLEHQHAEAPRGPEAHHPVAMSERATRHVRSENHDSEPPQDRGRTPEPARLMPAAEQRGPAPTEAPSAEAETVAAGTPPDAIPLEIGSIPRGMSPDDPAPMPQPARTSSPAPAARAAPDRRDEPAGDLPRPRAPEPPGMPETPAAPRPLLPEVPQSAETARVAVPAAGPVRSPRAADAEPPEVHVHIGRIDVTSVAEPQPPRRDPPRRRDPAMSLEAYLAKRKSGG